MPFDLDLEDAGKTSTGCILDYRWRDLGRDLLGGTLYAFTFVSVLYTVVELLTR